MVKHPNNDNGTSGVPTNSSPYFSPDVVSSISSSEINYQPGPSKGLFAGQNPCMIIIYPKFPTSSVTAQ